MRSALCRDLLHAHGLAPALHAKEEDLGSEPLAFHLESDAGIDAVGGDAARVGQRDVRQRDGVDDGGSDSTRPALRRRGLRDCHVWEHRSLWKGIMYATLLE